jgi:hypothetical protein
VPRRALLTASLCLVASIACIWAPASQAAPGMSATTGDANGNGHLDTVVVRASGARAARRLRSCRARVEQHRVLRAHPRSDRLTLRVAGSARPDTGSRLIVRCGAQRLRARDGASPVLLGARSAPAPTGNQRVTLHWSEKVRVLDRSHAIVVHGPGDRALPVPAGVTEAGADTVIDVSGDASSVTVRGTLIADSAGNRGRSRSLPIDGRQPAAGGLSGSLPNTAGGTAANPASASGFVDSIGVNVHLSYFDTAYGDFASLERKLLELGIRHIRDGACGGCIEQQDRLVALGAAGIRATLIMRQPGSPDTVDQLITMIERRLTGSVEALEGPNEYDGTGPGWETRLRPWITRIHQLAKASARLRNLAIIAPSVTSGESPAKLGDISDLVDCGNWHPYPGASRPTETLDWAKSRAAINSGGKPVCITETGYHNALETTDGHFPISEQAEAAYVPRLYLDYFAAGIPRTHLYELLDERPEPGLRDNEQHFGLLRYDFSEKPAFRALKNLISLVRTTAQAPSRPLKLSISGAPSDARTLVLQQDSKHVAVVLWRDQLVWDRYTRKPLPETSAPVRVSFGQRVAAAKLYTLESASSPKATWSAPRGVDIGVGPRAVVLQVALP